MGCAWRRRCWRPRLRQPASPWAWPERSGRPHEGAAGPCAPQPVACGTAAPLGAFIGGFRRTPPGSRPWHPPRLVPGIRARGPTAAVRVLSADAMKDDETPLRQRRWPGDLNLRQARREAQGPGAGERRIPGASAAGAWLATRWARRCRRSCARRPSRSRGRCTRRRSAAPSARLVAACCCCWGPSSRRP